MSVDPEIVKAMRNRTIQLERQGETWTDEDKEILKKGFEDGVGLTELAFLLQRSETGISVQAENMDLYGRKENPIRHKSATPKSGCLCNKCPLYQAPCPHWEDCPKLKEGN